MTLLVYNPKLAAQIQYVSLVFQCPNCQIANIHALYHHKKHSGRAWCVCGTMLYFSTKDIDISPVIITYNITQVVHIQEIISVEYGKNLIENCKEGHINANASIESYA